MGKIIFLIMSLLLLIGCSSQKEVVAKSAIFQSVSNDEALLLSKESDNGSCPRCGMDLVKYYKTNHAASLDEKIYQYCSIHCLQDHLYDGVSLKNPQVVDINSLKFIGVDKAYYVVGSNVKGTMSRISKYAFSSKEEAEIFQKKHGGEVMDFYKALEVATKDFKERR
ncbi:MAG: nitrous oxide reductase accessory protein NosL [Sulfurimonas denitrificans]|nr:nitrous oxide reductase accessory protein NosL [Sulfurimonas denitrificans]